MRKFLLLFIVMLLVWLAWVQVGRNLEWHEPDSALDISESITPYSTCERNIVGIQPYMVSTDYLSSKHFFEKLKTYFEAAKREGYFKNNTVVLLPEYVGTWLVINKEKTSVAEANTIAGAMAIMVLSNPFSFVKSTFNHHNESDFVAATIFRMKCETMASIYGNAFIELAKTYGVTINAGSIVLPGPSLKENKIITDSSQPLYNTSFIFYPNGKIDQHIIRKSFPIKSELPFVSSYPIEELPVFDLSIGKTTVLVCADSWYPQSYDRINQLNAEVVLVNSYCAGNNTMAAIWNGYDGISSPSDVDTTDVRKISEREAWIKYALPGRIKNTHAVIGVNVFLRGELWDLGTDGQPFFIKEGHLIPTEKSERAGIWSICF